MSGRKPGPVGESSRVLWPVGDDGRPVVRVESDPDTIATLTGLVDHRGIPDTYVRDGKPVLVEPVSGTAPSSGEDDAPLPLAADRVTPERLAAALATHVTLVRPEAVRGGGTIDAPFTPAAMVLKAVLSTQHWPHLPTLRGLISAPVLRPDGTLLQDPGYDPKTGLFLTGRPHMDRVPDEPSTQDVDAAHGFLLDQFLVDFPWRTDADRANYLALLVTPLLRPYTRALAPFGIVDATMPGSGKTILTSCIGLLVGQRVLTWPDDEAELRKAITTVLGNQVGAVVFDNLPEGHVINSANLARLITERTWTDRKLSTNKDATIANDRLWLATGNNLHVGGDMASRTVWVRLDPDCPAPEARTGFAIPNLDMWILDPHHQAILLRHLLILIVDWTRAGAPQDHTVPAIRQFTRWAQHVGGFLAHHGIPAFLGNHSENAAQDDEAAEWRAFLWAWHNIFATRPVTAADVRASAELEPGRPDPWRGTFPTTPAGRPITTKSLGKRLGGHAGRWRTDIVLRSVTSDHARTRVYWVEPRNPETKPPNHQTTETES
jgi:hypothetical protein